MNVLPLMPTICKTAHIVAARLPRHVRLSGVMDDLIQVGVLEAIKRPGKWLSSRRLRGVMIDSLRSQDQEVTRRTRRRGQGLRSYQPSRPSPTHAINRQESSATFDQIDNRDEVESLLSLLTERHALMVRRFHMEGIKLRDVDPDCGQHCACVIIASAIRRMRQAA